MIPPIRNLMRGSLLILLLCVVLSDQASAQSVNLDFGEGGSATARIVQLVVLLTVVTLAPSILLMVTSFTRIVIVLSLLRTGVMMKRLLTHGFGMQIQGQLKLEVVFTGIIVAPMVLLLKVIIQKDIYLNIMDLTGNI